MGVARRGAAWWGWGLSGRKGGGVHMATGLQLSFLQSDTAPHRVVGFFSGEESWANRYSSKARDRFTTAVSGNALFSPIMALGDFPVIILDW